MAKFAIEQTRHGVLEDTRQWLAARQRAALLAAAGSLLAIVLLAVAFSASHKVARASGRGGVQARAASTEAAAAMCEGGGFDMSHPALGSGMCQSWNQVCFDQGHIVSYDPAYSPANASSEVIPKLSIEGMQYTWGGAKDNGDKFHNALINYAPLSFRPAGILEEGDLEKPVFSNCTVVVMWSQWVHNFGEGLSHVAARVWQLSADAKLGNGSLLVMGTPAGERMRDFWPFLLQPYTKHPVLTFAELSSRTAPGSEPLHPFGRCYQTAYMCAFWDAGYFKGMYGAMQAVHEFYAPKLPKPLPEAGFKAVGDDSVLKVLIEHRNGTVRHLLNWQELLDECNTFKGWNLPAEGPIKSIECRHTTFTADALHNLAAVRPADVLVLVHGSGCSNWLSMREGSSMLEIRPLNFGSFQRGWSDWFYPQIAANIEHKVHWYAVNIEDPALSEPSQREKDGINQDGARYQRDRHTRLPFAVLRDRLELMARVNHDRDAYMKLFPDKSHYVEVKEGGAITPVT